MRIVIPITPQTWVRIKSGRHEYFFGGSSGRTFDRYYKAEINGREVEKHISNRGTVYAVGNIDKAKIKYKNESELLKALSA